MHCVRAISGFAVQLRCHCGWEFETESRDRGKHGPLSREKSSLQPRNQVPILRVLRISVREQGFTALSGFFVASKLNRLRRRFFVTENAND